MYKIRPPGAVTANITVNPPQIILLILIVQKKRKRNIILAAAQMEGFAAQLPGHGAEVGEPGVLYSRSEKTDG